MVTYNVMKTTIIITLAFALTWATLHCKSKEPVYAVNQKVLLNGSLFYNEAGCARCHGVQFDGKGPQAAAVQKEHRIVIPSFKRELRAKQTPLDYFKVITMGTARYKQHSYQSYTDRGRWALAHYLYSLSTPPRDSAAKIKRNQALLEMIDLVQGVYAVRRRWLMGAKPIEERSSIPKLEQLLKRKVTIDKQ